MKIRLSSQKPPVCFPKRSVIFDVKGMFGAGLYSLDISTVGSGVVVVSAKFSGIVISYDNPGIPRMLMPIRLTIKIESKTKRRPIMAEVMISLPALSLSGMPAEVVTIKTP